MGVSIAICELDTDASACKNAKTSILKVNLKDVTGFESCAEFDLLVPVAAAKTVFGAEFDAFAKRNRVDNEAESIYLDKVKNDSDKQKLAPLAKNVRAIHVIEAGIDVVGHQMDFGVDVPIDAGRDVMLQSGLRARRWCENWAAGSRSR